MPGDIAARRERTLSSGYALLMGVCLLLTELILTGAAHWAHKVGRKIVELGSWLYVVLGTSLSLFVNPSAYIANIFHFMLLY